MGSTAKALLALVQRKSNCSLEDFAVAIGASRDDEAKMRTNVDLLLKLLTTELANSGEWKLMEMANRHELKYILDQSLSCGHRHRVTNEYSDTIEFTVPLDTTTTSSNLEITETELQSKMDGYNQARMQVGCRSCKNTVEMVCLWQVPEACDPDFLTVVCKPPVNIRARQLRLQFSESSYVVKAVSQWDTERKMAAVSRQKTDGSWWLHGVVKGQAATCQYTEVQLESGVHFQNVAVLFAVREDSREEDYQDGRPEEENDVERMDVVGQNPNAPPRPVDEAVNEAVNEVVNEEEVAISGKSRTIPIEAEGDHPRTEADSDDEATKAMIEQAKVNSRKVNSKCLDQQQMVDRGLDAARDLGLTCYAHATFIPMDGRCLWSGIARSRNPSLTGDDLKGEADQLRTRAVGAAIERIDGLSRSDLEVIQAVVAEERKEALTKEQIIDELAKYMRSTEYAGKMGDVLFQVASAFLHQSLIIIQLREDGDYCLPVFPDSGVFKCHEEIAYPAVLVRQGDHFNELGLSEESRAEAVAVLQELKKSSRVVTLRGNQGAERGNEGAERQRMIPMATSTPVEGGEHLGPSRKRARWETTSTSLCQELDDDLQSSLTSSAGMEGENHNTQVHCALFIALVCLFVCSWFRFLLRLLAIINMLFFFLFIYEYCFLTRVSLRIMWSSLQVTVCSATSRAASHFT